ncbi:CLUMA_CG016149, isoform A [Clunio marinus]|uniref:CLUMA_CG016149, isoform A n=1 Tax=Clunio marinus TaxID=568069 RepID=A0A1J1IU52_9DIPT|nr:CLUMA_CG016149, isoform A [Clunio marinus]
MENELKLDKQKTTSFGGFCEQEQVSSSTMDGQHISTRPESPMTSYNLSQPLSSGNCSGGNSSMQGNAQFNGNNNNKCGNMNEQQNNKSRICRDFVRGTCRRLYCKYPHVQSSELVVFCHDFQNNKCPRINCKFLHYTIEEEDHYRKYGEFPIGQQQEDFNGSNQNNGGNIQQQLEYQNDNSFKNFFNGSNSSNSNRSLPSLLDGDLFHSCQQQRMDSCSMHCHNDGRFSNANSVFRTNLKRNQDRDCMQQTFKRCREDDIMTILRRFEEEHQMLKRRVEANELKIAELRASNEYLMTQNAQLRISTVQVSRVVNPVTVTNTQSHQQNQGPQVINASMAPIQVATPIVSMATPQTQLIATPQNMSGGPIALAANTSQPTQQILGTSQITLAPAALAPSISTPSIGLSINTSQALQAAISNATQPIISYPIMTHSILPH